MSTAKGLADLLFGRTRGSVLALLYGRADQSDVDVMVVGKDTLDQVLSRLSTVEKGIGRPLHPTVYSAAEFKSKLATGNHFLTSVLKGQKVFLVGDEDELRKVGGVRLSKARNRLAPPKSKIFWES